MRQIIEINKKNLEYYYNAIDGNLYYKYPKEANYQVLNGFTLEECKCAISNKVKFIWIEGREI